MADEFTYTNYLVEDIERYLGGRMNAKDMHDMERAALQDPFLADVIEGLQHQPFTQTYQHLDDIAVAIQGEKEPAKVVPLPVKHNYWWRTAAIVGVIVVAGAALWYTQGNKKLESKPIASLLPEKQKFEKVAAPNNPATSDTTANVFATDAKKAKLIAAQPAAVATTTIGRYVLQNNTQRVLHSPVPVSSGYPATVQTDSSVVSAAQHVAKAKAIGIIRNLPYTNVDKDGNVNHDTVWYKNLQAAAGVYINTYSNNALNNIKRTGPTDNEVNTTANNISNNVALKNVVISNNKPFFATAPAKFEGFVVDDRNQPLANATVYSNDNKHVTLTDSKGHFTLNTNDSQLTVQIASAGYYTKQAQLNNNVLNYITVNQQASALAGVEVTEFKNAHLSKKMATDSLFPEGGWQSFREYVYKKLHKEKDMDTTGAVITSLDKSVEIEFVVDENGLAQDLKIVKSVNRESDAKALEVVQQWPHWIATRKDRKGKVVIQF